MLSSEEHAGLQRSFAELPATEIVPHLERLATFHQDDARVWFLLGAARHRLRRLEAALEAFDHTLSLDPAHLQALNAKGGLLAALDRRQEALVLLEQARERYPRDPTLLVNLGYLHEQDTSGGQRALDCYDAALVLDPGNQAALMNRGYLLTVMKRLPEAVENNRKLAAAYPRLAVAHYNLAETLLAAMRPDEVLIVCDDAIALDSALAKAHVLRGLALAERG